MNPSDALLEGGVSCPPRSIHLNTRYAKREFLRLREDLKNRRIEVIVRGGHREKFALEWDLAPFSELSDYLPSPDALVGANLTNAQLTQINISNLNLTRVNLTNANCILTRFRKVNATEAILPESQCSWSVWISVKLSGANLKHVDFSGADISDVDFSGCDLSHATFFGARLRNTKFNDATLIGCDFKKAVVNSSDFQGSEFEGIDFSFGSVRECNFAPVAFERGNFYETEFNGSTRHGLPSRRPLPNSYPSLSLLRQIERVRKRVHFVRPSRLLFDVAIRMGFIKTSPVTERG